MPFILATLVLALAAVPPATVGGTVRIGVLGLLHPRTLSVRSADGSGLVLSSAHDACTRQGREAAQLTVLDGRTIRVECGARRFAARSWRIASAIGGPASVEVAVPGVLVRTFHGSLDVAPADAELSTIVTMALETAVASTVASELPQGTPIEALKAMAVAARSYLVAGRGRHAGFDFCDTTHCQFLREPPARDDDAARAASATAGLVIAFAGTPVAALHSASCGGRTRSLAEAGLTAGSGYPFFAVDCPHCQRDSAAWERRLALDGDTRRLETARTEAARLAIVRRRGWSAVPSNHFESTHEDGELVLRGRGAGHGIGLCQLGAIHRAAGGDSFAAILAAYYPGTTLTTTGPRLY